MSTRLDLAAEIKRHLDSITQDNVLYQLRKLFAETFCWDVVSSEGWELSVPAPLSQTLLLQSVAHAAGLPVFLVRWPKSELPGLTARRAVQRAVSNRYVEHLLCYLTDQADQLAFVWAKPRPDNKIELRTLPYQRGLSARTTLERLAELQLSESEVGRLTV
ncbi:MAG: hypothetical protein NZ602_11625, partial [Thermoguttaceae bacterium]|nr:hypothetical protein [Thermoguttaceae bacterium]MDW8039149.1 hypothetical protein [Thermoguttaceae bacterium]